MTEIDKAAHATAEYARLRRTLPRRVRLRLWWNRQVDGAAIWLVVHRRFRTAEALWRASGAWRKAAS